MTQPILIILSGPPCSGKTTIGSHISQTFSLPFIKKDGIKEILFDSLGWKDRAWSKQLSRASYSLLFHLIEVEFRAGKSLLVEGNFDPGRDANKLIELQKEYHFISLEVLCQCDGGILYERFKRRWESGERHPGHVDNTTYEELKDILLKGSIPPLGLSGEVIKMDTTDFERIDFPVLEERIMELLKQGVNNLPV
ncbi:MAG: AAA family ATPase [Omnitrophica WOR_2 bacterium]